MNFFFVLYIIPKVFLLHEHNFIPSKINVVRIVCIDVEPNHHCDRRFWGPVESYNYLK